MLFLIDSYIDIARSRERDNLRPAHRAYLERHAESILAAGAKLLDDGGVGEGSFYLIESDSAEEARAFISADPFFEGGLIEKFSITRVRTGFFNRKALNLSGK